METKTSMLKFKGMSNKNNKYIKKANKLMKYFFFSNFAFKTLFFCIKN